MPRYEAGDKGLVVMEPNGLGEELLYYLVMMHKDDPPRFVIFAEDEIELDDCRHRTPQVADAALAAPDSAEEGEEAERGVRMKMSPHAKRVNALKRNLIKAVRNLIAQMTIEELCSDDH